MASKFLLQALLGHHKTALKLFEALDESEQKSFDICLAKAQLLLKVGKPADAILVLDQTAQETALQKYSVFQLLSQAFLMNNEPKSAQVCLTESVKVWPEAMKEMSDEEKEDCERINKMISRKVEMERQNKTVVGNINEFAFLKGASPKVEAATVKAPVKAAVKAEILKKYDWYQNQTHVFLTFKVIGDKELAKKAEVKFAKDSVTIEAPDQTIVIPLAHEVNPDLCETYPFTQKLEVKLAKVQEKQNWMSLEPGSGATLMAQTPIDVTKPEATQKAKPYAGNKNWDKIGQDIDKELENEKPEGDAALNGLFKQIYERADEDTRRAMMKSYQTSGGTVLSTNWGEVHDKDYEGKDRPSAPDGQMWADDAEKVKASKGGEK